MDLKAQDVPRRGDRRAAGFAVVIGGLGLIGVLAWSTSVSEGPRASIEASPTPPLFAATDRAPQSMAVDAGGSIVITAATVDDEVVVTARDVDGTVRWTGTLPAAGSLTCGPCPGAIRVDEGEAVERIAPDGTTTVDPSYEGAPATGFGVILAIASDGTLVVVPPRGGEPVPLPDAVEPPVIGAWSADGRSVTLVGRHPDPVRLAEVVVVSAPDGPPPQVVSLGGPATRVVPCSRSDGSIPPTFVVAEPEVDGRPAATAVFGAVAGSPVPVEDYFDDCAAGGRGVILAHVSSGPTDDGSDVWHRLDAAVVDRSGAVRMLPSFEAIGLAPTDHALDAVGFGVAIVRPDGDGAALQGDGGRTELDPAWLVAFDETGHRWWVDPSGQPHREVRG